MLRTTNPQHSLWEAVMPAAILELPAELARGDHLLDAPAFWQPFRAHFDLRSPTRSPGSGLPHPPWRAGAHSTTLVKLTPPGGRATVRELNQALLATQRPTSCCAATRPVWTPGELATLAEQAASDAARVARNARRQLHHTGGQATGKLASLLGELDTTIGRTSQVIGQTRIRLAGATPEGATRLCRLHDPDARPTIKGGVGKPVEFGYKA